MPNSTPPNILWYCADQQRWDTIGALNNPHIHTPHLDALVGKGVAFERYYVQNQVCTPSRASFLTGRYPAAHKVYRNGVAYFPESEVLVTRLLADAGYACALVGKLHLSSAKDRVEIRPNDGYEHFAWSMNPYPNAVGEHNQYHRWLREQHGVLAKDLFSGAHGMIERGVPAHLHQSTWVTDEALRYVEGVRRRSADQPWLLSLNPYDPHPPFDPPEEYLARYDADALPPPLFRESDVERQKAFRGIRCQMIDAANPLEDPTEEEVYEDQHSRGSRPPKAFNGRKVKAAYYGMITLLDEQFGRLLAGLEKLGELENTLVLFTSDHGEFLGDHGLLYKGGRFFEGLVRVPLIAWWPGRTASGVRSQAMTESVDLAPTLLEAAGLPVHPAMQGSSLLPILTGQADPQVHKPVAITDFHDSVGSSPAPAHTQATMTCDGRHKLVVYHHTGLGELFDLEADPGEFENLWDSPAHVTLKTELMARHLDAVMGTVSAGVHRIATA